MLLEKSGEMTSERMKKWSQSENNAQVWMWLLTEVKSRRPNQSILKEISPEYSLEGLMMKLKLHYFGHLVRKTDSFEKILMLGKTEGRRRRG